MSHLLWIVVRVREERTTALVFRAFPEGLREETAQQGIVKRQEKKERNKHFMYIIAEIAAVLSTLYLLASAHLSNAQCPTHTDSKHAVCLPVHLHPNICTHCTHAVVGRDRSTVFAKAEGGSLIGKKACHISR